jgi:formamidopyrimidine-DNA glycosylase
MRPMPELPEVETVMRGLRVALEGHVLARVTVARPDMRWPLPAQLAERLTGQRVQALGRRAKYILVHLSGGETALIHLGMSGRMVLSPRGTNTPDAPHSHIVLETDATSSSMGTRIAFVDPRRFGSFDLFPSTEAATHPRLAGLGPEPLEDAFTADVLSAALAKKFTPIKAALLDQRVVAGLGNIYVSEALHRAGISPRRLALTVPGARAKKLVPAIKAVLTEAIAVGGSSLRDHVQPNGELGYFQHAWRVYGRAGERCAVCPGPPKCRGIAQLVQSGRSSFYCPRTQR